MAETEFKQLARPQRQLQWAGVKKYTYILLHTHIIHYYHIYFVEPPFGLRLLLPFWCRRGVVLVHGWCAEKENRGKAGSRQGKIGVGVGSCRSMDPVGIQSGCSPATLLAGIQSGSSRAPILEFLAPLLDRREAAKITPKRAKTQQRCFFLNEFGCLPTVVPDCIPTGSRLVFLKKKNPQNLSTYF